LATGTFILSLQHSTSSTAVANTDEDCQVHQLTISALLAYKLPGHLSGLTYDGAWCKAGCCHAFTGQKQHTNVCNGTAAGNTEAAEAAVISHCHLLHVHGSVCGRLAQGSPWMQHSQWLSQGWLIDDCFEVVLVVNGRAGAGG
jgi:hypothetical protein